MSSHSTKAKSVKSLPPIKSLFTDSWELLKKVLVPIIIFNVVVVAVSVAAIVMMLVGFLLIGFGAGFSGILNQNPLTWGIGAVAMFLIFFVVIAIISSIAQIGSVIIFYDRNPKISVFEVIKRSAKYILPLIGTGVLVFLIVFGGLMLFVIPGIVFSIFLGLAYYSVIVENKGPISALKRSVYLVKTNFSAFFLRILALWGVVFLVNVIASLILTNIAEATGNDGLMVLISLLNLLLQFAMTWFSVAYMITLFKQLQKIGGSGEASLKLISILSIVGWIIGILFIYSIINIAGTLISEYQKGNLQNELNPEERKELEKIFKEIDGEFDIKDIDKYMDEIEDGTNSSEIKLTPAQ